MSPQRWQRMEALFHAAMALEPELRTEFLESQCGEDQEMVKRVESLIESSEPGVLEGVVRKAARDLGPRVETVGNYRVLGELGEGGMGVVFEAEQNRPRRRVALKMMRAGRYAGDRMRRLFQREVEALGRLQHPAIATIYESGETADGQPYLAMELVGGEKLDRWLAAQPVLTVAKKAEAASRLRLFRTICDGVTYAHQNGVIHRDLKPSNIFVQDERPAAETAAGPTSLVKILDFGLARFTETGEDDELTQAGTVQGSIAYMSPEQARGEADRIDTRTDIYALGILLYQLLTSRHPYFDGIPGFAEAIGSICYKAPTPFRQVLARWDADLETIVQKALEKEPAQRYQSVPALAADLDAYLADQPIMARPPSTAYQVSKLVRRHRGAVLAAAGAAALLVAFSVVTLLQSRALRVERDRANQEAATARLVSDFLVDLFRRADPVETEGQGQLSARDLLKTGRQRLDTELRNQPELRARLLDNIGQAHISLGPFSEAKRAFEDSIRIREQSHGRDAQELIGSWNGLCRTYDATGEFQNAAAACERALEITNRHYRPGSEEVASAKSDLASEWAAQGDYGRAEPLARQAVEEDRKAGRTGTEGAAARVATLGHVLRLNEDFAAAAPVLEEAARELGRIRGETGIANTLNELGITLNRLARFSEAETAFRRALKIIAQVYGPDSLNLATVGTNLGYSLLGQERGKEAEQMASESLRRFEGAGENNPRAADSLGLLAQAIELQGRGRETPALLKRAYELSAKGFGPDHYRTVLTRIRMGRAMTLYGDAREGMKHLEAAIPQHEASGRGGGFDGALASRSFGEALAKAGRQQEARKYLEKSLAIFEKIGGAAHPDTGLTRRILQSLAI